MRRLEYRVRIPNKKGSIKVRTLAEAKEKAERVGGYYKTVFVEVPENNPVTVEPGLRWRLLRERKLNG